MNNEKIKNKIFLFTTKTCPGCETVKMILNKKNIDYEEIIATRESLIKFNLNITTVPFLLFFDKNGEEFHYDDVFSIKEFITNFKN